MNIIQHIRNCIFLLNKKRTDKVIRVSQNMDVLFHITKTNYTKKNSWVRNRVCLLIRKWRKQKPYQVIDYSKAKELYENQPEPIDFSKVSTGSYVVKFTEGYATKGKRWCEYYVNFSSGTGMFKVAALDKHIDFVDYQGNSSYSSLNEETSRSFRFATKEEIEEFKIARKNYKAKRKEIYKLQKQITKLYKQL